tara:strand:+ start:6972 stop:7262 length:291 start_codon:yes stop_codon:yes gene_type:complete
MSGSLAHSVREFTQSGWLIKPIDLCQQRKRFPDKGRDYNRADAANQYCRHRADSGGHDSCPEFPISFDAPVNTELTALTRPRISSGVAIWIRLARI